MGPWDKHLRLIQFFKIQLHHQNHHLKPWYVLSTQFFETPNPELETRKCLILSSCSRFYIFVFLVFFLFHNLVKMEPSGTFMLFNFSNFSCFSSFSSFSSFSTFPNFLSSSTLKILRFSSFFKPFLAFIVWKLSNFFPLLFQLVPPSRRAAAPRHDPYWLVYKI